MQTITKQQPNEDQNNLYSSQGTFFLPQQAVEKVQNHHSVPTNNNENTQEVHERKIMKHFQVPFKPVAAPLKLNAADLWTVTLVPVTVADVFVKTCRCVTKVLIGVQSDAGC